MDEKGSDRVRRSVFIVDDDPAIRDYYRKLFSDGDRELDIIGRPVPEEEEGIDLRMFADPGEMLAAFSAEEAGGNSVPLCILDSGPEGVGSLGTAKGIRAVDQETMLVICSASREADADILRKELRSSAFLVRKPFAADEFRLLVHSLLREWETRQRLRRNEARLKRIIEATRAGTWEWHVPSGKTVFNERWAEMVGYELGELEPLSIATWERLVHEDDRARSDELLRRHFAGELPYYDCECRMRHKDGRWVWVHDRGQVIERDSAGAPVWMSGTHVDISDRKEAELEREEIRKRLAWVIEATSSGIWDWDIARNVVVHNERWCAMLGLDESFLEHPISFFGDLINPEDRPRVDAAIKACLEGKGPYSSTHRLRRPDGVTIWVIDRGDVVERDEAGAPTRMVGSIIKVLESRVPQ